MPKHYEYREDEQWQEMTVLVEDALVASPIFGTLSDAVPWVTARAVAERVAHELLARGVRLPRGS